MNRRDFLATSAAAVGAAALPATDSQNWQHAPGELLLAAGPVIDNGQITSRAWATNRGNEPAEFSYGGRTYILAPGETVEL